MKLHQVSGYHTCLHNTKISDEDFDFSSELDLGEGDSGDEDCDPEFNENPILRPVREHYSFAHLNE